MYIYFTSEETNVKKKNCLTFLKSCLDFVYRFLGTIGIPFSIRIRLSIFILVPFDAGVSWNALLFVGFGFLKNTQGRNFQISRYRPLLFCFFFFFFTWFLNFYEDWSRRRVLWRELCIRHVSISRVCKYWRSMRLSSRSKGTGNDAPVRKSSANAWSWLSSGWNDIRSWGIRTFYARSGDIYTCPSSFSPTYNRHTPCCSISGNAPLGNYLKTSIRMMVNRG